MKQTIKLIYPDYNTRLKLNLEKIVGLRNISTHFITQEYEIKYAPLFQACVMNFINETIKFHKTDVSEYISQNFLTISASYEPLTNEQIKLKYPAEIAEKFIKEANNIDVLSKAYASDKFSIDIKQNLYITRKTEDADFLVAMHKSSDNKVNVIKEYKDPSNTHKYSYSNVITVVNERLKKSNILIDYPKRFNQYVLNLVIDFYNIKHESKFAYKHTIGKQESFTYSQQFIEFVVNEIKKNPNKFVASLKNKKITPGT